MKKILNTFYQAALTLINWRLIFAGRALKLETFGSTFSSFNTCLSLPSIVADDRK